MTLATRLKLTAILCALLTIAVCQALFQAHTYQQKIYKQLNHSMQIQLSIDSLRSQLWLYEEYSDQLSLSELNIRQADLAVQLSKDIQWHTKQRRVLDNLNRLNANIRVLFNTQMQSNTNHSLSEHQLTSSRLLKAKYSMNIEKMTEDMYRLHKVTIAQAKQTQQSLLISVSLGVLLLSILVTMWSSMTLIRFGASLPASSAFGLNATEMESTRARTDPSGSITATSVATTSRARSQPLHDTFVPPTSVRNPAPGELSMDST